MVDGEEVVVSRELREPPQAPATITPAASDREVVTLDLAMSGLPQALDPQKAATETEIDLIENLFVGLTRFNNATRSVEPDLATEWEVSEDGLLWTFELRSDIFWIRSEQPSATSILPTQSGPRAYRPVVADDVVFAVQRACDARTQARDVLVLFIIEGCEEVHGKPEPSQQDLASIAVRAVNESTVQFTLTRPAAYFSTITSLPLLRPVPREIVEAYATSETSWASFPGVVTSGRFIVSIESTTEPRTVLIRNPFWPTPFSGAVELINIYSLDAEAAYELWQSKGIDVSPLPAAMREELLQDTRMRSRLQLIPDQAVFYLAYNFDSEVFSDPAVRRAFGAAIDREALVEEVYAGFGMPMSHFTPPGVLGAPPIEEVGVGYSPDWARLQMAESSFRDCKFLPEIHYLVSSTDLALFHAETLRTMWSRELGCPEEKIIIEQAQFGALLSRTRPEAGAERPDLWDLGWSSYYPDAHNWLDEVLHCSDSENRQNRNCSQADELIAQAARTMAVEERNSFYRQAEELFFGHSGVYPVTPLFVQATYLLVHPWLIFEPAHFGGEQYDRYQLDPSTKRLERQQ